ncbi:MAG: hypothetical protein HXY23_03430 [Parvularculaceae bacterium]|nr:hypothetical protein [Parvularculaceae bacterium]
MIESTDHRAHYHARGYSALEGVAPGPLATNMLGLVDLLLTRPGAAQKAFRKPSVNERVCIELYSYHYPALTGFHWGLTARMCDVTGKRLVPTFGFFRVYQKGDVCTIHTDRPSCEHSLSMPLAYADDILWDFEIGEKFYDYETACALKAGHDFGEERYTTLKLRPGDAILYKGVNYRHGRMSPNPNRWSAHLFLHWVEEDGVHKEWAFDKQVLPKPAGYTFPAV